MIPGPTGKKQTTIAHWLALASDEPLDEEDAPVAESLEADFFLRFLSFDFLGASSLEESGSATDSNSCSTTLSVLSLVPSASQTR